MFDRTIHAATVKELEFKVFLTFLAIIVSRINQQLGLNKKSALHEKCAFLYVCTTHLKGG